MKLKCTVCHKYVIEKTRSFEVSDFFYYVYCGNCFNFFLYPFPRNVKKIYKDEYFVNPCPKNFLIDKLFRLHLYLPYDKLVQKFIKKENAKILDYGCGDSTFLAKMKALGWEVYGYDISLSAKKLFKRNIGDTNNYYSDLERLGIVNVNNLDCVTMWHVLEHLTNPKKDIKVIYKVLKRKAKLFIEVPNANSLLFIIFGKYYNWLRVPQHTIYWTSDGVKKFLRSCGFKKIDIYYPFKANLNFSFSILNKYNRKFLFYISIPLSLVISFVLTKFGKGEVIRVVAEK
ncbi:MAG: class I SAM-dependent methyltransferase [Patescibacteria group bacterium]|nr:class I SAM-dependent methyltransferase [Patescibacteria group bacterium]